MKPEMTTAISRLQELPEGDQSHIGAQINAYLNKLENLREMVREGLDSGPATPLDMDDIIRRGHERLAAMQKKPAS